MVQDAIQWIIDAVGKLGTLAVAVAVFSANRRQNRWLNRASVRAHQVEDQKMRLALLDRRSAVVEHLRHAQDQLTPTKKGVDAVVAVLEALRDAQMVFQDDERRAIHACLHVVITYQTRFSGRFDDLRGDDLMEAVQQHQECVGHLARVIHQLREATCIQIVAPLSGEDRSRGSAINK